MEQNNFDMSIYLKDAESIRNILKKSNDNKDPNKFITTISNLENYLKQVDCIKKSSILTPLKNKDELKLDLDEVKSKALFKINLLINECWREVEAIL